MAINNRKLVIGIDASRNRSGGARAHLIGILDAINPEDFGISCIHVWSYPDLLQALPNMPWLIKHSPKELECSLFKQLFWQRFKFHKEVAALGCDILLNTSASTLCRFKPAVTMSRDMLSFEPGEMERFPFLSKQRLRLLAIKYIQLAAFKESYGVIFLTEYASSVIKKISGNIGTFNIIPHGIGEEFRRNVEERDLEWGDKKEICCLYVSNIDLYKHQWHLVKAIRLLRDVGHNIKLTLVGRADGEAYSLLKGAIKKYDPLNNFVQVINFVPHRKIPNYLAKADMFIFASSCENMPNTLVEAMAFSLPIACSKRGPMPEILQDGGVYFDPEDPFSICASIESLINDAALRKSCVSKSKIISEKYSWARCGAETLEFLVASAERYHKNGKKSL